ncbi:hypothetical protein FBU59_005804 [Linderina macrospora]|uniref:Uncharacterized protein n=1 Tax=Linderina macrospora TaxID=4868 RepID=A0ACC1J1I9_9FUNG|nr:hypothetical protein FBU59_005804 [Linderina macrospora]
MSGLSSYLYSTLSIVSNISGIGGSGIPDFHFSIGEAIEEYAGKSIWELHRAVSTVRCLMFNNAFPPAHPDRNAATNPLTHPLSLYI